MESEARRLDSSAGPLPCVYYRRLFPKAEIMRSVGTGIVHRAAGHCVAYDFHVAPQPAVTQVASLTIQGSRWRSQPSLTYRLDSPRLARVYLPPGEWLNAIAIFDLQGQLLHARFDAATPPFWHEGACYQTDLLLDFLYDHQTGNYLLLDDEEYSEAMARRVIPQTWASAAEDIIGRLVALGDHDNLPQMLAQWCATPLQPTRGSRIREPANRIAWPAEIA